MTAEGSLNLTQSFGSLVEQHIAADPAFAKAMLCEGVNAMLAGDVETAKAIFVDYITATIGFEALGKETGNRPAALARLFGPQGNPRVRSFLGVLDHLQRRAGLRLRVQISRT
ncbi:MAG TPA: transcriptional regulator [Stellaceae bacterium]|nr:transcriptional regulator [Stellaceae bacterium]